MRWLPNILLIILIFYFGITNENKPLPITATSTRSNATSSENTFLVTKVIDGDTIEIEGGEKVRYIGIDTPELARSGNPADCYGTKAAQYNEQLVGGKYVTLVKDVSERDKYKRLLRFVYIDGVFVNMKLLEEGYAKRVRYPPDLSFQYEFAHAEQNARDAKLGRWSICTN